MFNLLEPWKVQVFINYIYLLLRLGLTRKLFFVHHIIYFAFVIYVHD